MADPARAERLRLCKRFWIELLERAQVDNGPSARFAPQEEDYVDLPTTKRGIKFCFVIRQHDAEVVLVIETTQGAALNQRALDALMSHQSEIEATFGGPIDWNVGRRTVRRRVGYVIGVGGYRDRAMWAAVQMEMIRKMERLHAALTPHVSRLHFIPDAAWASREAPRP